MYTLCAFVISGSSVALVLPYQFRNGIFEALEEMANMCIEICYFIDIFPVWMIHFLLKRQGKCPSNKYEDRQQWWSVIRYCTAAQWLSSLIYMMALLF